MSKKKAVTETPAIESYTVLYSGEAEKISPHSKGLLTFELGKNDETSALALRLTGNGEGGHRPGAVPAAQDRALHPPHARALR